MMERYNLEDARENLEQLIHEAQRGKIVFIVDENKQVVQLVPVTAPSKSRKAGSARGQIKMAADFDEPLSDFKEYMK